MRSENLFALFLANTMTTSAQAEEAESEIHTHFANRLGVRVAVILCERVREQ